MKGTDIRNAHDKAFVEAVRSHINLTDRQLMIFDYRYVRGYMAAKIADLLSISIDTVYNENKVINRKLAFIDINDCEELAIKLRQREKE